MRVVNRKEHVEGALYIGRGSKWGNPYKIGPDGDREEVILKYEKYLRSNAELWYSLPELLEHEALECYCAPEACHGDVLARMLEHYFDAQGVPRALRIVISGTRPDRNTGARYPVDVLRARMEPWMGRGNVWVLGGAWGVDNDALRFCQERDENYVVIVPFMGVDQPRETHPYLQKAHEGGHLVTLKLPKEHMGKSLQKRNIAMLEYGGGADLLLAFPDAATNRGGTRSCIRTAMERGIHGKSFPARRV